jgi:hypothetical protein
MRFPARCLCGTIFLISLVTYAQSETEVDRQSFMALSAALAYELGKTYQMGQNCDKELSSIGPARAEGLFWPLHEGRGGRADNDSLREGLAECVLCVLRPGRAKGFRT